MVWCRSVAERCRPASLRASMAGRRGRPKSPMMRGPQIPHLPALPHITPLLGGEITTSLGAALEVTAQGNRLACPPRSLTAGLGAPPRDAVPPQT